MKKMKGQPNATQEVIRMKAVISNMVSCLEERSGYKETCIPSIIEFLMESGVEPKDLELCKEVNKKVYDAFMKQWNSTEHGEVQ